MVEEVKEDQGPDHVGPVTIARVLTFALSEVVASGGFWVGRKWSD